MQLQESQQALRSNSEASDRELELEAQLVEARSIITEQVSTCTTFTFVVTPAETIKERPLAIPDMSTGSFCMHLLCVARCFTHRGYFLGVRKSR